MMGAYLLWGRSEDGKNEEERGNIELPRRNAAWAKKEPVESLDAILDGATEEDSPSIQPLYPINGPYLPSKIKKEVFSREEALKKAPIDLLPLFRDLWRQIDSLDLEINFFDLLTGKRKNPPRNSLLAAFTEEERQKISQLAQKLTPYRALKLRHLLVELRQEQFTLRDTYSFKPIRETIAPLEIEILPEEINVFPLGRRNENPQIFLPFNQLVPKAFSEKELKKISQFYWKKKEQKDESSSFTFLSVEDIGKLVSLSEEKDDPNLIPLYETFWFYSRQANFTPIQQEILKRKFIHQKNQDIADYVNTTFSKTYNLNYISTIYTQKILPGIARAAATHEEIIGKIFFEEEFKKCSTCGKILLRTEENFVRKKRAKDGFASRCKVCDKEKRKLKSEEPK